MDCAEGLIPQDLSNGITLPKLEQRLPKPIDPDELNTPAGGAPRESLSEKRDRASSSSCLEHGLSASRRALALDRTDFPGSGQPPRRHRQKGSKQRSVYLTATRELRSRSTSPHGPSEHGPLHQLRPLRGGRPRAEAHAAGARYLVKQIRREIGAWSFKSRTSPVIPPRPRCSRVTGGDVRLVQECSGTQPEHSSGLHEDRRQPQAAGLPAVQEFLDGKKKP
jgi:hypothetical protein